MATISNGIFFSDLDGTLLNQEARLSDTSYALITELLQKGLRFGIASARNLDTIQTMMRGLEISLPVISLNGAYISDIKTKRHLQINDINGTVKQDLFQYIDKNETGVFLSTHKNGKDAISHIYLQNEGEQWYVQDRKGSPRQQIEGIDRLSSLDSHKITCFTFVNRKEKLKDLHDYLQEHHGSETELHLFENMYSRGWFWLTVHSARATKSNAIAHILEHYNLSEKHLTVFGDGMNDLPMFELAHTAVAMSNAQETVKQKADVIIGNNNEDSVAKYLVERVAP
ncbi:HAD family hydrolase [Aureisphaera galaxeae]|uniref:HAD family hydrolase n=1 Tax=Aureisphaera galaxeae TaxID=1538023 RepID=UPI0023503AC2|nr:HAD family hydrolase [Aureisphaera galaxeae]MDC8002702.1 HAD family hydrolase [Aureisphaera galaxeae]